MKKKKQKKKKFVVWLQNFTDRRDDSWKPIWAHNEKEAFENVEFDSSRYSKDSSRVYTAAEFFEEHGIRAL
jgi:hypothetical protein